jgi:hypothetical protein
MGFELLSRLGLKLNVVGCLKKHNLELGCCSEVESNLLFDGMFSWLPRLTGSSEGGRITDFIDGLGPGQLVGRQALASPSLGDIQLSMADRRGNLEVEVIRARGLVAKLGSKVNTNSIHLINHLITLFLSFQLTPAPYVKVYLVKGKKCVAKAKTGIARRTLDPLYQQQLFFREKYQGCILQVTTFSLGSQLNHLRLVLWETKFKMTSLLCLGNRLG